MPLILTLLYIIFTFRVEQQISQDKAEANNLIKKLRDGGALIVRLKSRTKAVNAYRQAGKLEVAERILQDDAKLNKKIVDAFADGFRFCPVYFMYSNQTMQLLKGEKVIFLNHKLVPDSTIQFNHSFYLFVDFGTAVVNESAGDYNYSADYTKEGTTPGSSESYVILDKDLRQLRSPFPYKVHLNPFDKNPHLKAIERLNKKLFVFYQSIKNKK
ncbi:MAG: hypothetical protein RMJ53_07620 [Chitinophagales bacterium]|nr:hypothetical protein [Chitinophagales bacterium]MDW8274079.1 hypothetical protein [Chitinophagales bacterium]